MKSKFEKSPGRGFAAIIAPGIFAALALGYAEVCLAGSPAQTVFPSAEAGSRALFLAVQHHDEQALTKMLGAGEELVSSGDPVQDKVDRQQFIQKYQQMHRLAVDADGKTILYIGAENWPFPMPLVSTDGVWRFDPDDGQQEVLFRHIGENETTAIEVCPNRVLAESQPEAVDKTDNVTGALLAEVERNNGPVPFQAYYFRRLTDQGNTGSGEAKGHHDGKTTGGFALIAYPAAYRQSGVMSFIAGPGGIVYQKDLGPDTANRAAAMTDYHLDPTWTPVPTEP